MFEIQHLAHDDHDNDKDNNKKTIIIIPWMLDISDFTACLLQLQYIK